MSKIYTKLRKEPLLVLSSTAKIALEIFLNDSLTFDHKININHVESKFPFGFFKGDIRSVDVNSDDDYNTRSKELNPIYTISNIEKLTNKDIQNNKIQMNRVKENLIKLGIIKKYENK